jgi:hypothetical protein
MILDDEARARLVNEVLYAAVRTWVGEGEKHGKANQATISIGGEICLTYEATNKHGYGSFLCKYKPKQMVEKIVAGCINVADELTFSYEIIEDSRIEKHQLDGFVEECYEGIVFRMACVAALSFITDFEDKLGDALEDGFSNSMIIGKAEFQSFVVEEVIASPEVLNAVVDVRADIDEAAKKADARNRRWLNKTLANFPYLRLPRGRGRPERVSEAEYLKAIEARRERGDELFIKGLAEDLNQKADTVRKALRTKGIDLNGAE